MVRLLVGWRLVGRGRSPGPAARLAGGAHPRSPRRSMISGNRTHPFSGDDRPIGGRTHRIAANLRPSPPRQPTPRLHRCSASVRDDRSTAPARLGRGPSSRSSDRASRPGRRRPTTSSSRSSGSRPSKIARPVRNHVLAHPRRASHEQTAGRSTREVPARSWAASTSPRGREQAPRRVQSGSSRSGSDHRHAAASAKSTPQLGQYGSDPTRRCSHSLRASAVRTAPTATRRARAKASGPASAKSPSPAAMSIEGSVASSGPRIRGWVLVGRDRHPVRTVPLAEVEATTHAHPDDHRRRAPQLDPGRHAGGRLGVEALLAVLVEAVRIEIPGEGEDVAEGLRAPRRRSSRVCWQGHDTPPPWRSAAAGRGWHTQWHATAASTSSSTGPVRITAGRAGSVAAHAAAASARICSQAVACASATCSSVGGT